MQKLFIHIGTHKTGSTAIQRYLKAARKAMFCEKIVFLPNLPDNSKISRLNAVDENAVKSSYNFLNNYLKKYPGDYRFVISSEGLSGDLSRGYKNASVVASVLKEAVKDFDVRIILYLRRQDTFLESIYTQSIHQGSSHSFDEFLRLYDKDDFNWYDLVTSYSESFGKQNILISPYGEKAISTKGAIIEDFANIIGSDTLKNIKADTVYNPGYTRDALELARLCNAYLDKDKRDRLRNILQAHCSKEPFTGYGFFDIDTRYNILESYRASNAKVAQEYIDKSQASLFSNRINSQAEYNGLTTESAVKVLTYCLMQQPEVAVKELRLIRKLSKLRHRFTDLIFFRPILKHLSQKTPHKSFIGKEKC